MMIRARAVRTAVVAAGFALATAVTAVTPAAASTAGAAVQPMSTQATYHFTDVPAGGRVSCYGYYGTFLAYSRVMVVNWAYTGDECFGIATDRTIWHAWVGSGGWERLPGSFHADDVTGIRDESADGTKGVVVLEDTIYHHFYYQLYTPSTGWSGVWHERD